MVFLTQKKFRLFEVTLNSAGSDDVALFLRDGSAAALNSVISRDQVSLIETAAGVAQDDRGALKAEAARPLLERRCSGRSGRSVISRALCDSRWY